jgi:hypothetical protein
MKSPTMAGVYGGLLRRAYFKLEAHRMKLVVFDNMGWGGLIESDYWGLDKEFLPRQSSERRAKFLACKRALELDPNAA